VNGCDESAGAGPSELREETARDPSRLPWHTRERVEVVPGSHGGIDVGTKAFAGAGSVFWLVLPDPHAESVEADYVDFTRPACDAFKSRGVRRVVGVSALGRGAACGSRIFGAVHPRTCLNRRKVCSRSKPDCIHK
jgi:hypothetical protein